MRKTTLDHSRCHAGITVIKIVVQRQPSQTGVAAVCWRHATGNLGICRSDHLHSGTINMADRVRPGSHRSRSSCRSGSGSRSARTGHAVLPDPGSRRRPTRALTAVARSRRRCSCLVELLLVTQKQIPSGKASRALGAFKRLLFGVRSLVAFQMFQSGEGALASAADVWARLVGLGRREIGVRRLGVDGDGRGFGLRNFS